MLFFFRRGIKKIPLSELDNDMIYLYASRKNISINFVSFIVPALQRFSLAHLL